MTAPARTLAFPVQVTDWAARVDARLGELVPEADSWPAALHAAQRHALLSPGKRLRPVLTLLVARGYGHEGSAVMDVACVAEMIHAASLILDDLPCMDDAQLRRDRPTTHIAFSESTAILAATALLNRAFGVLARLPVSADVRCELADMLSYAVGSKGLIAGQVADLANSGTARAGDVERLNGLKTGALFDFCVEAGGVLAGAGPQHRSALRDYSQQLGLAFQLIDDLKDVLWSDARAGKSTSRDADKATLVALEGREGARQRLRAYHRGARAALARAGLDAPGPIIGVTDQLFAAFED